jgi:subtilase family serine protease
MQLMQRWSTGVMLTMLIFLIAACGVPPLFVAHNATPTAGPTHAAPVPTLTPTPTSAAIAMCPVVLRSNPNCLTPQGMREAYNVGPLLEQGFTGKGQTIIDIVSFGGPTLQQDLDTFDQQFGLPPLKLQIISPINEPIQDPYGDRPGWQQETELDVEIIHAIAPDAQIVVLTSPVAETEGTMGLPEFLQLEQYAIQHHLGNIISQSWGASELTLQDKTSQQELQQWDAFFKQATTQQHMTFFASSGDEGAAEYIDMQSKHLGTVAATSFPPDDPWVTAVGGTTLRDSGTSWNESVWNNADGASGGGFSDFFPTPSYQKTLPAALESQFHNRRGVPDVAAVADPETGLATFLSGEWTQAGGTSASAPLWAALMAIANQMAGHPLGFINPTLYKIAASSDYTQDFNDITVGNNTNLAADVTGYNAAPGWDAATGLGTPDAAKLLPALIAAMQ